jgi:hypothetical protein
LEPVDAAAARRAASRLAECARLAGRDQALDAEQRRASAAGLCDRAVAQLRVAVRAGFRNAQDLENDGRLAPLAGRADFAELLAELKRKR